ncbi:MAG: beta-ketothiolase BktB [Porticoccaceae bacterium]
MAQREVVIVSGVRTPIGDFGGSLKDFSPSDLAGKVIAEAVKRAGIEPETVDHVIIGNVIHTERQDMYVSRAGALKAGLSIHTPCMTLNRLCGSGLQSIVNATQLILLGDADTAVAGGAESMSRSPYWLPTARFGQRMGDGVMVDTMIGVLTCPMNDYHMGVTAENLAERDGISREDQDALAMEGHRRAAKAWEEKRFDSQILPIEIKTRKGTVVFSHDEHVRGDTDMESLAKLRPAFKKDGTVTPGNASGINDAAAAVVLMEKSVAEAKGIKPLGKVVAYTLVGVEPEIMGIGPVPAVQKLMEKTGLTIDDIDVWEVNEAFAAQALAVARGLGLPPEKVNPNGSGISLGHPVSATGTILAIKCLYELERIGGRYAVATMCIGGGQGIAVLFERT